MSYILIVKRFELYGFSAIQNKYYYYYYYKSSEIGSPAVHPWPAPRIVGVDIGPNSKLISLFSTGH